MSNDTDTTTPETHATKPTKSGLVFALGMILALALLVALNMG